jgi:hypothetical protein
MTWVRHQGYGDCGQATQARDEIQNLRESHWPWPEGLQRNFKTARELAHAGPQRGACPRSPRKSPVGQAISDARNRSEDLQTYTRDGELSIDNNVSETSARAHAIGPNNYLFIGSDRGARTAATLHSLVGTCKRHQIDPFAYLKDVLERLPTHPTDRLGERLPYARLADHPQSRRKIAS